MTQDEIPKNKRHLNAGSRQRKLSQSKNTSMTTNTTRRNKKRANSGNTSPRQNMSNGRPRQGQRPTGTPSASGTRTTGEPLKFDDEFDFEQANARFTEEIEKGMDKLKVADTKNDKKSEKTEEKDTSLTTSMSQQELQDQAHIMMKQKTLETMDMHKEMQKQMDQKMMSKEDQDVKDFYDKNISFFDRISCESNDKVMNQKNKNWKEERKINAETFGLQQRNDKSYYRNYNNNYNRNNYNRNNYNQRNQNMNNSLTGSNYRDNRQRQNYNNRPQTGNYNGMRNNYNNNGYNRREMEVNGNSQRRFGSR